MDYCSTCRRHLNGALVCPGCGAYAPDIAPLAVGTRAPAAVETATAPWPAPNHLWHDKDSGAEEEAEAPQEHPYDGPDAPSAPAPLGRAARRRQRERWKKTQRRALVATAVAFVGGGLTVASMERQSTDRTQAAAAPDREVMGIAEDQVKEPTPVSSTPTGRHRAEDSRSTTRSSTANAPHEQTATTPQATPTPQAAQPNNVTTPLTNTVSTAESVVTDTVSDATNTATDTAASPTPAATDSATDTSGTDTSTTPAPTESATSPSSSQLCLLGLVCIS